MKEAPKKPVGDIDKSAVPYTVFSGFCMGTADVVPGVSGGTMAVALGIYHQLLAAITSVGSDALRALVKGRIRELFGVVHWRFLFSLVAGIGAGIALMVKVVKLPEMVLAEAPERPLVYSIFFGMVLGSTFVLGRHIERFDALRIAAIFGGTGAGWLIVNLVPVATPDHPLFIFFCGAIAICAMLLPGISGSFILLILNKYSYVLSALGALDFKVIVPFALGCLTGLMSFSRLLKWLLDQYRDTVMAGLVGLLLGSLWRIWPYQRIEEIVVRGKPRVIGAEPFVPDGFDVSLFSAFAIGIVFVVAIEWYALRRKPA